MSHCHVVERTGQLGTILIYDHQGKMLATVSGISVTNGEAEVFVNDGLHEDDRTARAEFEPRRSHRTRHAASMAAARKRHGIRD